MYTLYHPHNDCSESYGLRWKQPLTDYPLYWYYRLVFSIETACAILHNTSKPSTRTVLLRYRKWTKETKTERARTHTNKTVRDKYTAITLEMNRSCLPANGTSFQILYDLSNRFYWISGIDTKIAISVKLFINRENPHNSMYSTNWEISNLVLIEWCHSFELLEMILVMSLNESN